MIAHYTNPWIFDSEIFDDPKDFVGFVYLLLDYETGKKYLGKKFFWSYRKIPGKRNRVKKESDWRNYYSSCEEIKELVKSGNKNRFHRFILSLHSLERDVNYAEVKAQFEFGVLERPDVWYNESINGKWRKSLVSGIGDRSVHSVLKI